MVYDGQEKVHSRELILGFGQVGVIWHAVYHELCKTKSYGGRLIRADVEA